MQSFKIFFESHRAQILEESLQARIDELNGTAVFGVLGDEYIENKFDEYKERGVVPREKYNLRAMKTNASRRRDTSYAGNKEMLDEKMPLTEKDYEEILPFVLKLDDDVRDKVLERAKGDEKKLSKINKFYNGRSVRPVFEDSEQISNTLSNWLAFRNKDLGVPKSLRGNNVEFQELTNSVNKAYDEFTGDVDSTDGKDVDSDIPDGFKFLREINGLRLYKWNSVGNACEIDPQVRKNWLSMNFDIAGDASASWCVASESGEYRDQYGQPDDKGDFQFPYYMVRKNSGKGFRPYVLMHGNSKQCKDVDDEAISEDIAEEIYPVVKGMLKQIIFG